MRKTLVQTLPLFITLIFATSILLIAALPHAAAQSDYYQYCDQETIVKAEHPANNYHNDNPYFIAKTDATYGTAFACYMFDLDTMRLHSYTSISLNFFQQGGSYYSTYPIVDIAYSLDDSWTTASLVYNTVPTQLNLKLGASIGVGAFSTVNIDLTSELAGIMAGSAHKLSLYVHEYDSGCFLKIESTYVNSGGDAALVMTGTGGTPTPTPNPSATPTATPDQNDPFNSDIGQTVTGALTLIVPLVMIFIPSLLGYKFAQAWGFFAGINIGVILCFLMVPPLQGQIWIIILIAVVDGLLLFGRVGMHD